MSEEKFSPEFIRKERELVERVTPLPWHAWESPSGRNYVMPTHEVFKVPDETRPIASCLNCDGAMRDNADYIVTAANHYPAALEEIERLRTRAERAESERDNLRRAIEDHQATINKWVDLYGEAHDQLLATEADAERLYDALKLCLPYAKEDYYSPETNECPYCDGNGDGDHKSNCKQVAAYFAARAAIRGHADTLAAHEARKGGEG